MTCLVVSISMKIKVKALSLGQILIAMQTTILDHRQIQQKIVRIAFEILETMVDVQEIHLVGIQNNGIVLAELLLAEMQKISDQKIILSDILVNKENPLGSPVAHNSQASLKNASVVLVDDVINSGLTIQYALNHLLLQGPYQIKTVTLVDRKHRRFPITANFVGLQLSTTLQERVEVSFEKTWRAYLI